MARSALAVQDTGLGASGLNPTFSAANVDGHSIVNGDGRVMLYLKNADAGAHTATFVTPGTLRGGITIEDPVTSIPAGEERAMGPFDPALFNQADGTGIHVNFDAVTSVTVAAIRMEKLF